MRAISATFGNTLQIGIPVVAGVFGETGLGLLLTLISVHALVLLLVCTTLVELDLAREQAQPGGGLAPVLWGTLRNALIHPVVLPVLAGLLWNGLGLPLPGPLDEVLQLLGSAMVPLCLTLIGMSLAYLGWPAETGGALAVSALKLLLQPLLVWAVAAGVFGLSGLTLSVLVVAAALPTGSNAMMFSQRYRALEAETTAVNVLSTLVFVLSAPLWLGALEVQILQLGRGHTKGDTVVWLPGEKTLLSGDLVEFDATPYAGDAYFQDWPQTLANIAALQPQALVPGRGPALRAGRPASCPAGWRAWRPARPPPSRRRSGGPSPPPPARAPPARAAAPGRRTARWCPPR